MSRRSRAAAKADLYSLSSDRPSFGTVNHAFAVERSTELPFWAQVKDVGRHVAHGHSMSDDKRLVYVLKSEHLKPRYYVGLTANIASRLIEHNAGKCLHT